MPENSRLAGGVSLHPVHILFFVLEDLTIKLVDEGVDRCVHILIFRLCVNLTTHYVERSIRNLTNLIHFQCYLAVADMVEVPLQSFKLFGYIVLQSGSQFYVMA